MRDVDLGDNVFDPATGAKGKVIGKHEWLNSVPTATVQGPIRPDGTLPPTWSAPVARLESAMPLPWELPQ